jgi:tetratricopeptide (TPR) repeat protein
VVVLLLPPGVRAAEKDFAIFSSGLEREENVHIFEAMDRFREAIALDPDNPGYREHHAWLASNYGFTEEAAAAFTGILSHGNGKETIYRGLAWNERQLGRYDASLAAYRKVIALPPTTTSYRAAFAEIDQIQYRENERKISTLQSSRDARPQDTELLKELFKTYVSQGALAKAVTVGQEVAERNPRDLLFRFDWARALFWNGEKERAERELRLLLAASGDSAYVWYELGKVQSALGKLEESQTSLERSLAIYPKAALTRKELAEVLALRGKSGEAVVMARSIEPKPGQMLTSQLAVARSYHFSGNLLEAREHYRAILAAYPQNSDAIWGQVESSIYTGRPEEADRLMKSWQTLPPDPRLAAQEKLLASFTSPRVSLMGDYYTNSGDFSQANVGATATFFRFETLWDLGNYFSSFHQSGFSTVTRSGLFLEGERRLTDMARLGARLGANIYDNGHETMNGRLSLYLEPARNVDMALNIERSDIIDTELPFGNAIYNYVVTIGAVGEAIQTWDYSLYTHVAPLPNLDLAGKLLYGAYSDGNDKYSLMFDAAYTVMRSPSLKVGYNYFFLDYRKPASVYREGSDATAAYYDPTNFEFHTLFVRFSQDLGTQFRYGIEERISYIPKASGVANALFGFLDFKLTENDLLRLDARYYTQDHGVSRTGVSGNFHAENAVLSYTHTY